MPANSIEKLKKNPTKILNEDKWIKSIEWNKNFKSNGSSVAPGGIVDQFL